MLCCGRGRRLDDVILLDPPVFVPGASGYHFEIELGRRTRGKSDIRSSVMILVNGDGVSTYNGEGHTSFDTDQTWHAINKAVSQVVPDENIAYGLTEGLVACAIKEQAEGMFSSPSVSPSPSRSNSPVPEEE